MKTLLIILLVVFAFSVGYFFDNGHTLPPIVQVGMMLVNGYLLGQGFLKLTEDME